MALTAQLTGPKVPSAFVRGQGGAHKTSERTEAGTPLRRRSTHAGDTPPGTGQALERAGYWHTVPLPGRFGLLIGRGKPTFGTWTAAANSVIRTPCQRSSSLALAAERQACLRMRRIVAGYDPQRIWTPIEETFQQARGASPQGHGGNEPSPYGAREADQFDHGVTGFIVKNETEAVQAVGAPDRLDRRNIRRVFEQRFTARRMAQEYMHCFEKLDCQR